MSTSVTHVYVMELTIGGGEYGYISVHYTYEGARASLEEHVDRFGVRDEYTLSEAGEQRYNQETGSVVCASEDGDTITYGISRLPVLA